MAKYEYAIGTTAAALAYLFDLGIPAPRQTFKPFSKALESGAGSPIGMGWGIDEWYWGFIQDTPRGVLKGLCAGLSSQVHIRTYNDSLASPEWEVYRARMIWTPEAEDRENNNRMKFGLIFRLLEKIV